MTWVIKPYAGVGKLAFNMSPGDVAEILGTPLDSNVRSPGDLIEYRDMYLPNVEYKAHSATEFIFGRLTTNLLLFEMDVFEEDAAVVLEMISEHDDDLLETYGIVVSLKLGVSFSGFHDGHIDQKSMTVFKHGLWTEEMLEPRSRLATRNVV